MKSRMLLILGMPCLAVIIGCPLSTDRPVAEPQDGLIDDRLIGSWLAEGEGDDASAVLILPFNRSEYYAELADDGETTRFRFYVFDAGGARFLHVEELSGGRDAPEYSFARYEMPEESRLDLRFVGDELAGDVPPSALAGFLASRAEDPELYDDDTLVLRRK